MILHRPARHLHVVKGNGVIAKLLVIFVPLAGDEDDVAWLGQLDGTRDRGRAVGHFFVIF